MQLLLSFNTSLSGFRRHSGYISSSFNQRVLHILLESIPRFHLFLTRAAALYQDMCRIEKYTDVYLQETRIRKKIRKCLFSPSGGTCKRTRVRDHGKVYHRRRVQIEDSRKMPSIFPKYEMVQVPPEPVRSKKHPIATATAIERRPSPKRDSRSYPFRLYLPFLNRAHKCKEEDRESQRSKERGRERPSRPFVVDAPEPRRYRRESSRPRIRTDSPERGRSSAPDCRSQRYSSSSPWNSQPHLRARRPRERSPVNDRVPLRRTHSSPPPRPVEIHNYRSERSESPRSGSRTRRTDRSPQSRRVRFANDVECERMNNANKQREMDDRYGTPPKSNRSQSLSTDYGYDIIEERPNRRYRSRERHARGPSPWPEKSQEMQKPGTIRNTAHARPRIIQEGYQLYPRPPADYPPNIEIRSPRSRGRNHFRPEYERVVVCDADYRRYGGRWH